MHQPVLVSQEEEKNCKIQGRLSQNSFYSESLKTKRFYEAIILSTISNFNPFGVCPVSQLICRFKNVDYFSKTDEFSHRFGGPLLAEEKPLVGMWSGRNDSNDTWEIIRRPNHTYSIQVKWIEEGKRESFRGHGLWAVKKVMFTGI